MKKLTLPESEVQGTPLTPEEQKTIVVIGKPTISCNCSYTLGNDPKDENGNKPVHSVSASPNTVEDCAILCASTCNGHKDNPCDKFSWEYVTKYSGNGQG